MIIDKELIAAKNLAYTGTADTIDFGVKGVGPGEPVTVCVAGHGLTGATGVNVEDSDDGSTFNTAMTVDADIVDGKVFFTLPSDIKRYVTFSLAGTVTAGTWDAYIVLDAQTNN